MLTNKQNKDVVNKQELTYTELKMSKSQQKQKTPKKNQSNVISCEQVTYMEIKFPRTSHLQRRKQLFRKNRKGTILYIFCYQLDLNPWFRRFRSLKIIIKLPHYTNYLSAALSLIMLGYYHEIACLKQSFAMVISSKWH